MGFKKSIQQKPDILESAAKFVIEMNETIPKYNLQDDSIWNGDQTSFEYEMQRDRTYATKGRRTVEVQGCDQNALTHSYTVQIHLSKNGMMGK